MFRLVGLYRILVGRLEEEDAGSVSFKTSWRDMEGERVGQTE